jgi:hypothetical protein
MFDRICHQEVREPQELDAGYFGADCVAQFAVEAADLLRAVAHVE